MSSKKFRNLNTIYKPQKGKGRLKGTKNADKIYDHKGRLIGKVNQYGVEFSTKELEDLRRAVNSVKRKAKNIREKGGAMALLLGYDQHGNLRTDKDYLFSENHSYSMAQFKTKQAYLNYMERLNKMKTRGYEKEVANEMKRRYILAMKKTQVSSSPEFYDVIDHIRNMSLEEFAIRVGQDVFESISYVYNPDDLEEMWEKIKSRVGFEGGLKIDVDGFYRKMKETYPYKPKKQTKTKTTKGKKSVKGKK